MDQFGQLIKDQGFQIDGSYALLKSACAVGNNVDKMVGKVVIGSNLGVPGVYKVLDEYRDDGVQLKVELVGAGQGRQQVRQRLGQRVGELMCTQGASDKGRGGFVGIDRVFMALGLDVL
jgi:hypothetical protein